MYAIDKDVPIPARSYATRPSKYPLGAMAVGDSFLIPGPQKKSIRTGIYASARKLSIKLRMALTAEGLRVWRVQ